MLKLQFCSENPLEPTLILNYISYIICYLMFYFYMIQTMCVIIVRVRSGQEENTETIHVLILRTSPCTEWSEGQHIDGFVSIFRFYFSINDVVLHTHIHLNECYNCTSSMRTGDVYSSDLSFLVFLSSCVVW